MSEFVLAADIGGTKIATARVSREGKITHSFKISTPLQGGAITVRAVVNQLKRLPQTGACGLGVDVPGLATSDGRVWAPNIPGWDYLPLRRMLERQFRLPVVVESDRNAFVAGEAWRGAARNCKDVVFLAVGTGIGAGILADGRLIRGHANLAGAVGWMAVRDQLLPGYASQGCLESEIAGPAIARTASAHFGRAMSAEELVEKARRGNKQARQILGEVGRHLGLALANLVSTLNPRVVVLGGGVARAGDMLLPGARKTMRQWGQPFAVRQVRVVPSQLGPQAALLGLAKLAFEHFDSLPRTRNS